MRTINKQRETDKRVEKQLKSIHNKFIIQNTRKFIAGQKEHGGDFGTIPTIHNIRDEALDLINYTHMLEQHHVKLVAKIDYLLDEISEPRAWLATQLLDLRNEAVNL